MSDFESRARKAADAVRSQIDDAATDEERNLRRAKRHTNSRVVLPSTLLVVMIVAAGLFAINRSDSSPVGHGPAGSPFELAGVLQPFNACDDVLQYFKDEAPQYYLAQTQNGGRVMPLMGRLKGLTGRDQTVGRLRPPPRRTAPKMQPIKPLRPTQLAPRRTQLAPRRTTPHPAVALQPRQRLNSPPPMCKRSVWMNPTR